MPTHPLSGAALKLECLTKSYSFMTFGKTSVWVLTSNDGLQVRVQSWHTNQGFSQKDAGEHWVGQVQKKRGPFFVLRNMTAPKKNTVTKFNRSKPRKLNLVKPRPKAAPPWCRCTSSTVAWQNCLDSPTKILSPWYSQLKWLSAAWSDSPFCCSTGCTLL